MIPKIILNCLSLSFFYSFFPISCLYHINARDGSETNVHVCWDDLELNMTAQTRGLAPTYSCAHKGRARFYLLRTISPVWEFTFANNATNKKQSRGIARCWCIKIIRWSSTYNRRWGGTMGDSTWLDDGLKLRWVSATFLISSRERLTRRIISCIIQ